MMPVRAFIRHVGEQAYDAQTDNKAEGGRSSFGGGLFGRASHARPTLDSSMLHHNVQWCSRADL